MTHTMLTFRLHRSGVVLVALGALLLGILLFMAGCIAGMRAGLRFGKQQTAGTSHLLDEAHDAKATHPPHPSSPAPGRL
jgi:hypothetical protein